MALIEKISYRGWSECYKISNHDVSLIINASAGGRIMVFERNGVNLIFENPEQDGKLLADYLSKPFDPDGGRFDYGQELLTSKLHAMSYMGPWEGMIMDSFTLKITSQPDTGLGIRSVRIFRLSETGPELSITQSMENISDNETSWFFWGRTLVKTGGKLFMHLKPKSIYPEGWGRYIWGDPVRFENDPSDKGVKVEKGMFSLTPDEADNSKYGNDSQAGWMAYGYKGILFVKQYGYYKDKEYGEHYGQTNIFYTNKKFFAEMEPVSPVFKLKKGESVSYSEKWFLLDYPPAVKKDFDVHKAKKFIKKEID